MGWRTLRTLLIRRRTLTLTTLVAASLSIGALGSAAASTSRTGNKKSGGVRAHASAALTCNTTNLQAAVRLPDVTVNSATPNTSGSFSVPANSDDGGGTLTGLPPFCDVVLTQTDTSGNPMQDDLWLPDNWNGRFLGVGGSGWSCGIGYGELASAIQSGYASASTDCGVGNSAVEASWLLTSSNALNTALIADFAAVGIHDMTVTGKAVTETYYVSAPRYSYFNGCSTGGREGLMEAQQYPADYNGIVSGAPAINWTKFIPAEIWPEVVMNESNDFLPSCKEQAFIDSVTTACGGTDGVIQNPDQCRWSPYELVGLQTPCGTITSTDASVMEKIWQGPTAPDGQRLWYGLEPGASLSGLAGTTTSSEGVTTGSPFPISEEYIGLWLLQNPNWNWQTLTYSQFDQLFAQSLTKGNVIATDNPDLSQFERDGGKIVIWHGLADQLIFPQGTINYYQRVEQTLGTRNTSTFARLFLAPGASHCRSGAGPAPNYPEQSDSTAGGPLPAVTAWVEHGTPPASILATKVDSATNVVTESRPLCPYPSEARYVGHGSPNVASSYVCSGQGQFWGQRRIEGRARS